MQFKPHPSIYPLTSQAGALSWSKPRYLDNLKTSLYLVLLQSLYLEHQWVFLIFFTFFYSSIFPTSSLQIQVFIISYLNSNSNLKMSFCLLPILPSLQWVANITAKVMFHVEDRDLLVSSLFKHLKEFPIDYKRRVNITASILISVSKFQLQ